MKNLPEWLAWQQTLTTNPIEMGLDRVRICAERLDILQPTAAVITVGGTNGKGSVSTMLDYIYRADGYRVGLYTSPHLLNYNERIRIDGRPADDKLICEAFAAIEKVRDGTPLTYFEFGTLAACYLFAQSDRDLWILEVGLGGRLDAVNMMDPDVAILTTIGLDHQEWLGTTREQIGFEKAGIFREARSAVCGDRDPPLSVLTEADRKHVPLTVLGRDFDWFEKEMNQFGLSTQPEESYSRPQLQGGFQLDNAAVSIQAIGRLQNRLPVSHAAINRGLSSARLDGRLQTLCERPTVIADVGHNPHAVEGLARWLADHPVAGQTIAVMGVLADKDVQGMVTIMDPLIDAWHLAGLEGPRGLSAVALNEIVKEQIAVSGIHTNVTHALEIVLVQANAEDRILVFGSFYTAGSALTYFSQEHLISIP